MTWSLVTTVYVLPSTSTSSAALSSGRSAAAIRIRCRSSSDTVEDDGEDRLGGGAAAASARAGSGGAVSSSTSPYGCHSTRSSSAASPNEESSRSAYQSPIDPVTACPFGNPECEDAEPTSATAPGYRHVVLPGRGPLGVSRGTWVASAPTVGAVNRRGPQPSRFWASPLQCSPTSLGWGRTTRWSSRRPRTAPTGTASAISAISTTVSATRSANSASPIVSGRMPAET
jgi:hypothetical protein